MTIRGQKDYDKIKNNSSNIRFKEFISIVKRFGFELDRIKGSHHFFKRSDIKQVMNIQPDKYNKSKAKAYQIKQLINIIETHNLLEETKEEED